MSLGMVKAAARKGLALMSLVLGACAMDPDAPAETARASSAILGGTDSAPTDDAVVLVMHYDALQSGGGTEGCTGVMLAPNLVLTARHCVAVTDTSASCRSDGTAASGAAVHSDREASAFYVFAGRERPNFISGLDKAARGVEIVTTGATTLCNADIALLRLDRALAGARIAPVRLDAPVVRGELVKVVGWGITEETDYPALRQSRDGVEIVTVGPAPSLGPAEFRTGEGTCAGDSGGPALASESGAVLGVLSRGGNGSGNQGADNCTEGENVFTSAFGHAETIRSAYEKAGQEPWLEGEPEPIPGGQQEEEDAGGCAIAAAGAAVGTSRAWRLGPALALVMIVRARRRRR